MATSTCTIVSGKHDLRNEIPLVTFSNGKLKRNIEATDLKIRCFYSETTEDGLKRKRLMKILLADNGRLEYMGNNYGPNALKTGGLCRFHVGVLNKLTGEMEVYPSSLFQLKPQIHNDENSEEENTKTYREKVDDLTSAFGSKKKRRTMESRQRQSVHNDSLQSTANVAVKESVVEKTISAGKNPNLETSQPEAIPPRNNNAIQPSEVYDLNQIIPKEEYDALLGYAEEICSADKETIQKWTADNKYTPFVLSWLPKLPLNPQQRLHTAVQLLYFNHLAYLLRMTHQNLKRKDPLPDVVEPVKQHLLERFTLKSMGDNGRIARSLPQRLKDKIIAYAIVTALHIQKYSLELSSVQLDLKVGVNRLITISYALGCYVTSQKLGNSLTTKVIELRVPLFVKKEIRRKGLAKGK